MEEIKNKDNNSRPVTKYQVKDIDMNDYVIPDDDMPVAADNTSDIEADDAGVPDAQSSVDEGTVVTEGTDAEPVYEAGLDQADSDAEKAGEEVSESEETDAEDTGKPDEQETSSEDAAAEIDASGAEELTSDDTDAEVTEEKAEDAEETAPELSDSEESDLLDELAAADDESVDESGKSNDDNRTRIFNMLRPEIHVAWMYPDTLYLHGERGNIMALVRYGQELGLSVVVHRIDLGTKDFDPLDFDIMFFGPGEISCFERIMKDISGYKRSIAEYLAAGRIMLVTGTTVAMFGERVTRYSPDSEYGIGETIDGLCLIPAEAREREYVFGDDLDISAEYGGYTMELVGNQIQMVDLDIRENSNFARLGSIIYGRGNNGTDGSEGLVYNNAIFTNMLGPVLVGNPWLAVLMLKKAARDKGINIEFADPSYDIELKSLVLKKEFIDKKREALTEEE